MPHRFSNLRLPLIAAPMFLTSGPELVAACCENGVVGTFPALNQRSAQGVDAWLTEIETRLAGKKAAPFGVNLIVHKTNPRVMDDLAVCEAHKVPLIITSLGAVPELVGRVHAWGGLVFHDIINAHHAHKAAQAGVDGLILVTGGAGGHAGNLNPFALMGEVRQFFNGTIILAGALSTGRDIAAAQMMGADYAYMGTRFIATREALVPDAYKEMIVESSAADILYTPAISSIPANFLRPSIVAAGLDPEHLVAPQSVDLAHVTDPHNKSHAKAWKDVWSAGQGVGNIHEVLAAKELIAQLEAEYAAAVQAFKPHPHIP
jgi:nitronate monooxygenase